MPGKTSWYDSASVLDACIQALADLDADVVGAGHQLLPRPLPANFRPPGYAPGQALDRRADVMIHHGGHGSTLTALAAGTPALIIPTYSERESNARHAARPKTPTTVTRGYTGKTMRVLANAYTARWDAHPGELEPFPAQISRSMNDGAFHLGGDGATPGVDPGRECYPAGQGIGTIGALVPASEIVRTMVAEAEVVLRRLSRELPAPA